jgi:hypothetical protein
MPRTNQVGKHCTTVVENDGGCVAVTYHRTTVWARHADGSITLDNGGWRTRTTLLRMNQAFNEFGMSGCGVYQRKGVWYVRQPGKPDAEYVGRTYEVQP